VKPVLSLKDISLSFGGPPLFKGLSVHLDEKAKVCLVGRNGCGKSTLLRILAKEQDIDSGQYFRLPGIKVAYLPQRLNIHKPEQTVLAYVEEYAKEQYLAATYLTELSIPFEKPLKLLSGGEQRRLSLAAAFAQAPDVILLDEPTNHIDITTIEWLEEKLKNFRGAFVVISHDRQFLKSVSRQTWWLDRGQFRENDQGFEAFESWSEFVFEEEERQKSWLDTRLRQEAQWLQRGVTARRKRNQGRLRKVMELREQRRQINSNQQKSMTKQSFLSDSASRLILEAEGIYKSFEGKCILKPFDFRLMKGERIGIMGPNGTGKTTLIRMLVGDLDPDGGTLRRSQKLSVVYLDQMQDSLDPSKTLWENMCPNGGDHLTIGGESRHVVAYLKDFMFDENQVRGLTSILSGGERNRLALAKALTQPCDFLVLDEPTNDLDSDTLDLLLEILSDFSGTLMVVSHDRDFLDQLVNSLLVFEGNGNVQEYIGGYQDYLRQSSTFSASETKPIAQAPKDPIKRKTNFKNRLSYNEKRQWEMLPGQIDHLMRDILELEAKLADPLFYEKDRLGFEKITAELLDKKNQLDLSELTWLELDEKVSG
jgi:ATP-binding cassette subfamily F protein uup